MVSGKTTCLCRPAAEEQLDWVSMDSVTNSQIGQSECVQSVNGGTLIECGVGSQGQEPVLVVHHEMNELLLLMNPYRIQKTHCSSPADRIQFNQSNQFSGFSIS